MKMKGSSSSSFAAMLLVCCWLLVTRACGSAIPMWEFLTRQEKMSHLYRIFGQEVAQFCADSPMPDCNKNLLVAGLRNLANIDEDQLDEMDPYQRGAKDIIWRAMSGSSSNSRQTGSRLGQQHIFQTNVNTDADPLAVSDNELPQETSASYDYVPADHSGPYLMGPMVIRVYPDGRPVPSDAQRPLPRDEDIDDLDRSNSHLPSLKDIESMKKSPSTTTTTTTSTTTTRTILNDNIKRKSIEQQQQQQQQPAREMLPPRRSYRTNFYRLHPVIPTRFYTTRFVRPNNNNLLVRERFY